MAGIKLNFCRPPGSNAPKWFKFDDGEVSEAKLDDEEVRTLCSVTVGISNLVLFQEFKSQCFGGDFTGEVYDHVLKK